MSKTVWLHYRSTEDKRISVGVETTLEKLPRVSEVRILEQF